VSLVQVVSRTSDFVGILSVCLVELAATLVLTEVSFPGLVPTSTARPFVSFRQWKPLLYKTKREIRKASYLPQQCAKLGGKVLSANFPHSPSRMWNNIPTVRMQSRPPTYNFQFLIPLMKKFRHPHCCGPAITRVLGVADLGLCWKVKSWFGSVCSELIVNNLVLFTWIHKG